MITLTGGNIQDGKGNLLNGFLTLQLTQDATLIASPALVVRAIPITFQFANGNLVGSCKCYSNLELTPGTQYQVSFADGNRSRLGDPTLWQFTQSSGATVDIGTMVTVTGGVTYPVPIVQNPTAQQNINGQTLNMEGASVGFSQAGSTTADSFFSRISAGIIAVGTAIGNALGTFRAAIFQIGGSDTGLSRDSAGVIDVGNGTQGDKSGTIKAASVIVVKSDGTLPVAIQNDGGGNIQIGTTGTSPSLSIGPNPFSAFSINPGTALVSNPSASQARRGMTYGSDPAGDITIWYNSAQTGAGIFFKDGSNGAIMAVPPGAGQLVSRTTTDTLTNKTLASPTISTGVSQGSGFKHQRFGPTCTTAATADTSCSSVFTWTSAFADTSYTVVCQGEGNTGGVASLFVSSKSASQVTIAVVTPTATAVSFSVVDCIAVHD
jgi:hypothetical protein